MNSLSNLWEDYLRSIEDNGILQREGPHGARDIRDLVDNLRIVKQKIGRIEMKMATDTNPRPSPIIAPKAPNTGFLEKLKIPVFSGDELEYAEFKSLFSKIFQPLLLDDVIVI